MCGGRIEYWSEFDRGFCIECGGVMDEGEKLNERQIEALRRSLVQFSTNLLGIPYEFGAELENYVSKPLTLDCSEMTELIFNFNKLKMPDGSQNQANFCIPVAVGKPGDLAFFGRGGRHNRVYHVGMVYSDTDIIEARAFDPTAAFRTGEVILRPRSAWEAYKNFLGYRSHPKLV